MDLQGKPGSLGLLGPVGPEGPIGTPVSYSILIFIIEKNDNVIKSFLY